MSLALPVATHSARYEEAMAKRETYTEMAGDEVPIGGLERLPSGNWILSNLPGTTRKPGAERKSTGFSRQDGGCATFIC